MTTPITIGVIQKNLESDRRWRERRHWQWTLNYELYRDTVIVNRLTQRQSVNVPCMKKTLKTYLIRFQIAVSVRAGLLVAAVQCQHNSALAQSVVRL
jgi:hypothetical protein